MQALHSRSCARDFIVSVAWMLVSCLLAGEWGPFHVRGLGVPVALAQTAVPSEIGWLGLFNRDLVEWLENENQLAGLCSTVTSTDSDRCRAQKLAPKIHLVGLRAGPSENAAAAGSLLLVAVPGRGLRSFFVPVTGGVATEFQPDLFDADWGYGPVLPSDLSRATRDVVSLARRALARRKLD